MAALQNRVGRAIELFQRLLKRRRVEQALRESEERYRTVVEASRDGIVLVDMEGNIQHANAAYQEMVGYTLAELRTMTYQQLTPERWHELEAAIVRDEILPHGVSREYEKEYIRKDGTVFPVGLRCWRMNDPAGHMCGIIRDITERKQAEEVLLASEKRLKAFLENSAIIAWLKDEEGRYVFLSENYQRRFGMRLEDALGKTDFDLWPRAVAEEFRKNDHAVLAAEAPIEVVESTPNPDGSDSCWLNNKFAYSDSAGRRYVGGLGVDITARKRAEEALHKSEQRFSAIVASAMDAIIAIDAEQKIMLFNKAAEIMFGYTAEEVLGTPIDRLIPQRFRAAHAEHITLFGESGATTRTMGRLGAVSGLRANGEEFPIEASISQLNIQDRRIFTVILRDITERTRAETALKNADRQKDEFLATLAHELRNPLTPIHNAAYVLTKRHGSTGSDTPLFDMIQRQTAHLVRLVDELLEISRINLGKIELRKESVDMSVALRDALETCGSLFDKKGHSLEVNLPSEPLLVFADPVRLVQILGNLINNAGKYTMPGGVIQIDLARERGDAVMRVRDNGVGIEPKVIPKIFEIYAQTGDLSSLSEGGLGIGLAVVSKLVALHGGSVTAKSEGLGKGSEFAVRLPLLGETQIPAPQAATGAEQQSANDHQCRIMVVDDEPDVGDSLGLLLECFGANVRVLRDGFSCIAAIGDFQPDIVFVDLGMPGVDGYETARRIRHGSDGKGVTLIALTGRDQAEHRRRSTEAGFDLHLVKPASIDAIEKLLQDIKAR